MCCNTKAPKPPDMSGVAAAQQDSARYAKEISQEQIAWAKEQWAAQEELMQEVLDVQLPMMEMQMELAGQGMEAYLAGMEMQMDIAWENHQNALKDRDRYERVFQPIEDDLIQEFLSYDTQARQSLEAGKAQSDVARVQDAQRKQALQQLEGYGIDPSQTRHAALDASLRTQQSAQMAAAGNQAREKVENVGRALRGEAINIGKGMPSNVAASYQTALAGAGAAQGAGNQAQSNLNTTMAGVGGNAAAWQGAGGMLGNGLGWNNASQNATNSWGNTLQQGYQNRMTQFNNSWTGADTLNLAGGLGGMALGGWMSSFAEGGEVDGPGGPTDDAVPAKLSDGEFVIPEKVVRRKGLEFFEKLIAKAEEDQSQRDAEMQDQQQRAKANQQGLQMAGAGVDPAGPLMLAEGGAATPERGRTGNQGGFGYNSAAADVGADAAAAFRTRRQNSAQVLANMSGSYSGYQPNSGGNPYYSGRGGGGSDYSSRFDEIRQNRTNERQAQRDWEAQQAEIQRQHEMEQAQRLAELRQPQTDYFSLGWNAGGGGGIRTQEQGFNPNNLFGAQRAQYDMARQLAEEQFMRRRETAMFGVGGKDGGG